MQVCKYAGMQVCEYESMQVWDKKCHFLSKQSFGYFVNQASNQKPSFTKVVQLGELFNNIEWKVEVKLSFDHKTVLSSLSELCIESNRKFVYKSCSVWLLSWLGSWQDSACKIGIIVPIKPVTQLATHLAIIPPPFSSCVLWLPSTFLWIFPTCSSASIFLINLYFDNFNPYL